MPSSTGQHILILHLATVFGGAERTTTLLLSQLSRELFSKVTVVAPEIMRPHFALPQVDFRGVDDAAFNLWYSGPSKLRFDAERFGQLLLDEVPDLVLGMMHYSSSVAVLGARLAGFSGRRLASFRGPAFEHIRRYEHGIGRHAFVRMAISATALLADGVIVPSRGTARELTRRFFCPPGKIFTVSNGIDRAEVRRLAQAPPPATLSRRADRLTVTTVARLSPEKRVDTLLRAFTLIAEKYPVDLAVVGDGPTAPDLKELARELGIGSRVNWLGHQKNVYPVLRRSACFVHCCEFEGFGYAMLEALACGTPVIAHDCPYGPRDVLDEGRYGLLVPPEDVRALADALEALMTDPERRAELAAKGKERAAYFSISRMVNGYESIFLDLVANRKGD